MRTLRFLKETPCATLLLVQLLGVLLYPFLEGSTGGRAVIAVFGILVLGAALLAVRATPTLTWVAGIIAVPAVVLLLVQVVSDNEDLVPWSAGFEAVLYFYAAFSLLRYMLADDKVTRDELFAVGAVFTVIAWGFAHVFVVVQALEPGGFTAAENAADPRSWSELLFLSFTTLSSTGLSDILPIKPHARSVVMFEQVAGVFYLAMVVTRLIGLSAMKRISK